MELKKRSLHKNATMEEFEIASYKKADRGIENIPSKGKRADIKRFIPLLAVLCAGLVVVLILIQRSEMRQQATTNTSVDESVSQTVSISDSQQQTTTNSSVDESVSQTVSLSDSQQSEPSENKPVNVTDDEFEVKGYPRYHENSSTFDYFVTVKNNSSIPVEIMVDGTARDSAGTEYHDEDTIYILGPEEESIAILHFPNEEGIDIVDYTLQYNTDPVYEPILSDLNIEETIYNDHVTSVVSNTSEVTAKNIHALVLFFDENENILYYGGADIGFNDSIRPGETFAAQFNYDGPNEGFDHVNVYYSGRAASSLTETESELNTSELDIEDLEINVYDCYDYRYNDIPYYCYYLVITNHSDSTVHLNANAIARDNEGNAIGASKGDIYVLGPEEQSILDLSFKKVNDVAKVEFTINSEKESSYKQILSDLKTSYKQNEQSVDVTVSNEGDYSAEYVFAYVLFLDKDNNLITSDWKAIGDGDREIKAGASLTQQYGVKKDYDRIGIYLTGQRATT